MLGRVLLFFSSYSPLFVLLAIRVEDPVAQGILVLLAASGVLALALIRWAAGRIAPRTVTFDTIEDRSGEVAGYIATYLLPLITVAQPSARDWIAYGIFLLLVGVIYVNSSLLSVNPLAQLAGYRLVRARGQGLDLMVLTRSALREGQPASVRIVFGEGLALV